MAKGTINKVLLLGRIGQDPEVRQTQQGTTIANISLATNDGMGDNITTEWHKVVVFGKSAEAIQKYAKKGTQLFIEGRLRTNKWQDKNGNTQYTTEVIASSFQFIGGSNSDNKQSSPQPQQRPAQDYKQAPQFNANNFDDSILF
ncbi:single-stranded DNA-binding protein [Francisella marina]|uniref:Single-stranded DNA-binding protein n=1 Tax=Francisella marina TaxID=2249302 RepID=A0ABX5ZGQ1_9GAMM|nr:single-stranded DNA-binding protein [Francisella marina]QEO57579.1 single-stranded DNA-binding protein [Francisella marina]